MCGLSFSTGEEAQGEWTDKNSVQWTARITLRQRGNGGKYGLLGP